MVVVVDEASGLVFSGSALSESVDVTVEVEVVCFRCFLAGVVLSFRM